MICQYNQLTVNLSKACFRGFCNKNTNSTQTLSWGDTIINTCRVPTVRYLGVHVNENISWTPYIHYVCNKINK